MHRCSDSWSAARTSAFELRNGRIGLPVSSIHGEVMSRPLKTTLAVPSFSNWDVLGSVVVITSTTPFCRAVTCCGAPPTETIRTSSGPRPAPSIAFLIRYSMFEPGFDWATVRPRRSAGVAIGESGLTRNEMSVSLNQELVISIRRNSLRPCPSPTVTSAPLRTSHAGRPRRTQVLCSPYSVGNQDGGTVPAPLSPRGRSAKPGRSRAA